MIPLMHDFTGRRVVVFGGGPVGARKARRFAREAETVVVSPAFADRSFGDATLLRAAPEAEDVADWFERIDPALAVAATDDEAVNAAVARVARERAVLFVRADRSGGAPDDRQVTTPATVTDGPVTVAVATGGAAPALSRELRGRIDPTIEGAGRMAELLGELRGELKRTAEPADRRDALRAVAGSPAVWKGLRTGQSNGRREARRIVEEHV